MTTTEQAAETPAEAQDVDEIDTPDESTVAEPEPQDAEQDDEADEGKANRRGPVAEARKYRERAQAAEAERDALRTQRDALAAEVVAGQLGGLNPDLFAKLAGPAADYLTEAGTVDAERVAAARDEILAMLPAQTGPVIPSQGVTPDPGTGPGYGSGDFAAAFRPKDW